MVMMDPKRRPGWSSRTAFRSKTLACAKKHVLWTLALAVRLILSRLVLDSFCSYVFNTWKLPLCEASTLRTPSNRREMLPGPGTRSHRPVLYSAVSALAPKNGVQARNPAPK